MAHFHANRKTTPMSARMLAAPLFLGLIVLGSTRAWSEESPVKQGLAKLFEVGSQNTIKSRSAASDQYKELRQLAPADSRIIEGYAIIQIKLHNYPEAVKLIDEVLASDKTDLYVWKTKSWLSVITKNYAAALVDLDRFSQLMPAEAKGGEEEQQLDMSRYLGRVFGFLEGPVADAAGAAQRESAKKKILARLSEPRQMAFEEGRSRVLDAFNSLGAEKEESAEKAKVVAEEEREKLIGDLEARKEKIAARRSEIGPQRDKLRSEIKAENDQLLKEQQPFLNQLNVLNAQAAGLRRELDIFVINIQQLQGNFEREKDPIIRGRIQADLDRANILAARVDGNLVVVQRQAAGVNSQLALVQQKHVAAANRLNNELARLDNELAGLDKQERRNGIDTTKAKKPAVGDVRRSRSLSAQASAFSTYEEFPLETEKQRLLESYK